MVELEHVGDGMTCSRPRLVILASHAIQYYVPLYRALTQHAALDVHVLYCTRINVKEGLDPEFGVVVRWNMDLFGGYAHAFLPEAEGIATVGFSTVDNPSVAAALMHLRPDVVVVHGYAMKTMLRALAWCRLRGIPVVLISDSSTHGSAPGLRRAVKLALVPALLRQYSAFLTMGDRNETHLAGLGAAPRRMFRTPPLLPELFWSMRAERAARRAATRTRLGVGDGDVVLLSVGKIYARKRVGDILDALQRVRARTDGAPVRLVVAGDGVLRRDLEASAGEGVRFLGFVNVDALSDLYCAADALVHPAEREAYGMVVLEAAVLGLPLIVSDAVGAVGPTSIARPGVNALVYPCGDPAALAAAIGRLRDDPGLAPRLAQASLDISTDHLGPTSVAAVEAAVDACLR